MEQTKLIQQPNLHEFVVALQEAYDEGYVLDIDKDLDSFPQCYNYMHVVKVWKPEAKPVKVVARTKKEGV